MRTLMTGPYTLLVVDDEEDLTWSISKGLNVNKEFQEVFCAKSAEHALEILSKNHIHLIVTDLRMPGMGGIELIRRVSRSHPEIKLIVMSAFDNANTLTEAGYVFRFIEKPFEIRDLRNLINKSLQFNSE